jgi:hypothetical protein
MCGSGLVSSLSDLRKQIQDVKELLNKRGPFLRASIDETVEEIQPTDTDRSEDDTNYDSTNLCHNVESSIDGRPYTSPGAPLSRKERNFFQYFLDGSIRTYYWGEKLEGNTGVPIMIAEVASAVVSRDSNGTIKPVKFKRNLCLITPGSPPLSDDTWGDIQNLEKSLGESISPKLEVFALAKAEEKRDLRNSLAGKARSIMHDLEHELAAEIKRDPGNWLIIDGAIRKELFLHLSDTIGLAKSFSRRPAFSIDGSKNVKDVVTLLGPMRQGDRTLVFKQDVATEESEPIKKSIAFWYLRLRSGTGLDNPLQGIVKVEMHHEGEELTPDQIEVVNTISRALLAEKYVSAYPVPRWPAHIYPIYTAENYIKASMFPPIYIRGLLSS